MDPDERQDLINSAQPQDQEPVTITYYQAMKCAAIIDALALGHTGYADGAGTVANFLQVTAVEATQEVGAVRPSANELWTEIEQLPWPMFGPPRPQAN